MLQHGGLQTLSLPPGPCNSFAPLHPPLLPASLRPPRPAHPTNCPAVVFSHIASTREVSTVMASRPPPPRFPSLPASWSPTQSRRHLGFMSGPASCRAPGCPPPTCFLPRTSASPNTIATFMHDLLFTTHEITHSTALSTYHTSPPPALSFQSPQHVPAFVRPPTPLKLGPLLSKPDKPFPGLQPNLSSQRRWKDHKQP